MRVRAGEGGLWEEEVCGKRRSVGRGGLSVGYALNSIYPYPWEKDLIITITTTTRTIVRMVMLLVRR